MPKSKKSTGAQKIKNVKRSSNKKSKKKFADQKKHEQRLQDKLKQKGWDPIKESLEIMDEYEEGTPKRKADPKFNYWGE